MQQFVINTKYFDPTILELQHTGDWVDLRVSDVKCDVTTLGPDGWYIPPNVLVQIFTGVGMILPCGYEAIIKPRSSTFKNTGLIWVSSGVIDEGYCGNEDEWFLVFYSTRPITIFHNDRVAQFRIQEKQPHLIFNQVSTLSTTSRGGYGSTGVK